jgi:hypothetical protein
MPRRGDVHGFVDALERLLRVRPHRDRVEPLARLGLPSRDVVLRWLDKVALVQEAAAAGLPGPATTVCHDAPDAAAAARELGFPLMIKPVRSFTRVGGELRNVASSPKRLRFGEAAAILRPRRRVVHAHVRLSDPAPLVAWALNGAFAPTSRCGTGLPIPTSRRTPPPAGAGSSPREAARAGKPTQEAPAR